MTEKLKSYYQRAQVWAKKKGVLEPQNIGLYAIALIAVSVMYNGSKVIQQNYELTQQVRRIEQENQVIQLENQNKELQNQYYATDEYADIVARSAYGRALPGEKIYIVPNEVSESALSGGASSDSASEDQLDQEIPQYRKNIEAWLNIYFGDR